MFVLVTGPFGRVGTALIDNKSGEFENANLVRRKHSELESVVWDVAESDVLVASPAEHHHIGHPAVVPNVDRDWYPISKNNIIGSYNCPEACYSQDLFEEEL